jgi:hypothetical protein
MLERLIEFGGEYYDPYHILQVTQDDTDDHIKAMFVKKAKRYHPDKAPKEKRKDYKRKFEIVLESYNYIRKLRGVQKTTSYTPVKTQANHSNHDSNTFGYGEKQRLASVEEYDATKPQIKQAIQGGKKHFDSHDFNRTFEYVKTTWKDDNASSSQLPLIQRTSDGFWGYNSGQCDLALVNSFNGLMIVGDNLGEKGIGYWSDNYGDYKKSYESAPNPQSHVNVPSHFTRDDILQDTPKPKPRENINIQGVSRTGETKKLFERVVSNLEDEREEQKKMVLRYANNYDRTLVEEALRGRLEMSPSLLEHLSGHYQYKLEH